MKAQYVGYETKTYEGKTSYNLFLLKAVKDDEGAGLKPMTKKYHGMNGVFFPKVDSLPTATVGNMVDVFFDEDGKIESIKAR